MHGSTLKHFVRWGLVAVCLGTPLGGANAGSFTRGCAARDLQVLMLIEEGETSSTIPTAISPVIGSKRARVGTG